MTRALIGLANYLVGLGIERVVMEATSDLEAFGFGTPGVALRAGGYLDSCVDGVTGLWVEDPSVEGVVDGLRRFRAASFDRDAIIAHGAQWSPQRFAGRLAAVINEVLGR